MDGKGVYIKRQEADEEMLSDTPFGSGGYADADEAVSNQAYVGSMADAVLKVDSNLSMQP